MSIGLIIASAKPFHIGHMHIVKRAAEKHENVLLYVSTKERKRRETRMSGDVAVRFFCEEIVKLLPENVTFYLSDSPLNDAWEFISRSSEEITVWCGEEDVEEKRAAFSTTKNAARLVNYVGVKREETESASGEKIRAAINDNDYAAFVKYMPSGVSLEKAWSLFRSEVVQGSTH